MTTSSNRWDSFWAIHATNNDYFHRFLWSVRFIFSKYYANLITNETGQLSKPNLIEIGCGSARTLHYLEAYYQNSKCFALDTSPFALELVKELDPEFIPCQGDGVRLPIRANHFDISFSIGLIEHFSRETAAEIVMEKMRITKPGGLVIVMVPWINSFYNHLIRRLAGSHWPFGDEQPFHRQELIIFLNTLGLINIKLFVVYGTTLLAMGYIPT